MPKLGMSMEEGELVQWLAADGEQVAAEQIIYSVATDKTEVEVESPYAGVLHHVGEEGVTYEIGTLIGWIEQP